MNSRRRGRRLMPLLLAACALLAGCTARAPQAAQTTPDGPQAYITVDGTPFDGDSVSPDGGDGLRVYITLDGEALLDLPFDEAHTVEIVQPGVGENAVELTGEAVFMRHADCENQDCVNMGAVTRDNLDTRVMGGFIVCLPHRISVEVRDE